MKKNYTKMSYDKFIRKTIITSTLIITVLFGVYGYFIQSDSIKQGIKNETSVMVDLIFHNLFIAMKSGYNKQELDNLIIGIEEKIPNSTISIFRDKKEIKDKNILNVFDEKKSNIYPHNGHVDFVKPIFFKNECLKCHNTNKVDDLAAVISFEYPLMNLNISLKDTLTMFVVLFGITIFVIFLIWYIFVKKYFVFPIKELITQMQNVSHHHDLNNNIKIDTPIKEIQDIESVFNEQNKNLLKSYNELEYLSNIDTLTGIYNRKKFDELSEIEIHKVKRYKYSVSFLVLDLNKFKYINDNYGHDIGDEVLVKFTQIISNLIRDSDIFFRTGGDEFIIILPYATTIEAQIVIKKIKDNLKNNKIEKDNLTIEISASIGLAEFKKDSENLKDLIKIADERMYIDKQKSKAID